MQWFLFLFFVTLALSSPLQCPPHLPATCSCECNFRCHEPIYLNIHCSTVPDLYELLSTFENARFFEIKIDKCKKLVQNLTKLPPFHTICLIINHCGLESVADNAFADVSGLELLDLSNNALTVMPVFPHFRRLTYIAINHNQLRDFGEPSETKNYSSFDGVPELTQLYFQNNSLTEITDATFANLKELRTIDLSNNKLQRISANAFRDQPRINDLHLNFNELTYLEPETFRNTDVMSLLLNNNRLTHLKADSFNGNKNLGVLHLEYNQLTDIAVGTFNGLEDVHEIRLNNNNLTSINGILGNLPKLRIVNFSNNQIIEITNTTFNNFWKLRLDLSNNSIQAVAPNAFKDVMDLTLSNNNLSKLDGVFMKDNCIHTLNISKNSFTLITNTTFYHLTKLYKLSLADNQINYVAPYSFVSTNLDLLDISNNNLTTLEPFSTLVKSGPPQELIYKGNPIICDENLKWFTEYLKYEVPNGRWYEHTKPADKVYTDPVICPEPLKTLTTNTQNKETYNCTC